MSRLAFPFSVALGRSDAVAYGSAAHVRQMLELTVFTMPEERVMRPDFGAPVRQMVFGPAGGPMAIALEAALQAAIQQELGHVLELVDLSVTIEDATLEIAIGYEVLSTRQRDTATFARALT